MIFSFSVVIHSVIAVSSPTILDTCEPLLHTLLFSFALLVRKVTIATDWYCLSGFHWTLFPLLVIAVLTFMFVCLPFTWCQICYARFPHTGMVSDGVFIKHTRSNTQCPCFVDIIEWAGLTYQMVSNKEQIDVCLRRLICTDSHIEGAVGFTEVSIVAI